MTTIQLSPNLHSAVKSMKSSETLKNESTFSVGQEVDSSELSGAESKALFLTFSRSVSDRSKQIQGDWS
ncbi:hypothetical protein [Paenibacillus contaminans]|uniref:hypothetical protein n=1 Tax=Paenibacillus contaminans TaxID=450362 RepID=UPI001313E1D0|nr:hypothetical protein [Paenibacillus contaminans]